MAGGERITPLANQNEGAIEMKIDDIMPSTGKYLKAGDLQGRSAQVTIQNVAVETMRDGSQKPVLYFMGKEKGLTLNVTNKNALVSLYGQETDDWLGKPVILFSMLVDFQGQMVNAIRIRGPEAQAAPQPAPQPEYRSSDGPMGATAHLDSGAPLPPNLDDSIPFRMA